MSKNESELIIKKLRAKQIAQMYGIGLSTVWLYSKRGRITPIKISSYITVFDAKEVDEVFSGGL